MVAPIPPVGRMPWATGATDSSRSARRRAIRVASSRVSVTGVTFGGVALTHVPGSAALRMNGTNAYGTDLWYLLNPPSGPATVQINWAGPLSRYGVGTAISYTGVNQSVTDRCGFHPNRERHHPLHVDHDRYQSCPSFRIVRSGGTIRWRSVRDKQSGQIGSVGIAIGSSDGAGISTVNDKTPAGVEMMDWT